MQDLESDNTPVIVVPDVVTSTWAAKFGRQLEEATWKGPGALRRILSVEVVLKILHKASLLLKGEPTLLEILEPEDSKVVVVGDTHGQLHDIQRMFQTAGEPSSTKKFVLNGDFVDRGAWGLETLLVFLVWKLAFPSSVYLLRGNHETTTCTTMYGFKGELEQKYGKLEGQAIYKSCKRLFATLPLAACIGRATLVLHGGLFRKPVPAVPSRNKRKKRYADFTKCELGSLEDLRASGKGGLDPNGRGTTVVATDVLWSDPVGAEGLCLNTSRGVGVIFGPDITQRFLEENGLKLILRSHEGPDARFEREDMASMQDGWTLDHKTPAGNLLTIFSAPDYPQFQPEEDERYCNLAAVAVLSAPDWCSPEMLQYEAVLPRPAAVAFYDYLSVPGSDEELEIAGSEASQASIASTLGDLDDLAVQSQPPTNTAAGLRSQAQALLAHGEARLNSHQAFETGKKLEQAGGSGASGQASDPSPSSAGFPEASQHAAALSEPETANGNHCAGSILLSSNRIPTASEPAEPKPSRTSLRQQQRRDIAALSKAGLPGKQIMSQPVKQPGGQINRAMIAQHPQASQSDVMTDLQASNGVSKGVAASKIAISQEAVAEAGADLGPADAALSSGDRGERGVAPSQDLTPPLETPLSLAAPALPTANLDTGAGNNLTTPAQIVQMVSHPGRELEQAAAHTLALKGGVAQDTPETTMSKDVDMLGKVFTSPIVPQLQEGHHSQPLHATSLERNLPRQPSAEVQGFNERGAIGHPRQGHSEEAVDGAIMSTNGPDASQPEESGADLPERQQIQGKRAVLNAEGRLSGGPRPAKRSKPPAPWR